MPERTSARRSTEAGASQARGPIRKVIESHGSSFEVTYAASCRYCVATTRACYELTAASRTDRMSGNCLSPMPYSFHFDSANRIVLIQFTGSVTDELLTEFHHVGGRRVFASLEFNGSITDYSNISSFEVTPETIRTLAWEEPIDPDSWRRPRVIVAPEPHVFGLCRIFASHGADTRPNLHVVRRLEHAYAILSVVNPKFEPIGELGAAMS